MSATVQTKAQTDQDLAGVFFGSAVEVALPETASVGASATRAELARVRYLHELERGRGPLELSPGAYTEAIAAGWLSPSGQDALRADRERLRAELDTLRLERARLEIERETARAECDRLRDELATARNQRARPAASWCLPSRNPRTG